MRKGSLAILSLLTGVAGGIVADRITTYKNKEDYKYLKFKTYYYMTSSWLGLVQSNKNLSEYFEKNNYKKIGIYGLGILGERLSDELKDSNTTIAFAIDENAPGRDSSRYPVYLPEEIKGDADVIVVTAVFAFEEIKAKCSLKVSCPIISLEDVIYGI